MQKLCFEFKRDPRYLDDGDIYDIVPIHNLSELVKDGHSLCIVWRPRWERDAPLLCRIQGILHGNGDGIRSYLYYALNPAEAQSATKNALDRSIEGKYLFSSWKQDGIRTFRIIRKGKELARYPTLEEGLADLIPGNFEPCAELRRKLSVMSIMLLQAQRMQQRRELYGKLVMVLGKALERTADKEDYSQK